MGRRRSASVRLTARQNARLRERLLALCEREGLSERALADKADISVGTVQSIGSTESGPTLATLFALTRALGLQSIDELLGPSPTALVTADERLEIQLGEGAICVLMRIDQQPRQSDGGSPVS